MASPASLPITEAVRLMRDARRPCRAEFANSVRIPRFTFLGGPAAVVLHQNGLAYGLVWSGFQPSGYIVCKARLREAGLRTIRCGITIKALLDLSGGRGQRIRGLT